MNHDELIENWNRMDKAAVDIGLTAEAMSAMLEEITRLRQRAEAAEKRAQIAEYQRNRALSYAEHCYHAGYIGIERMTWEQYLRV